MTAPAPKFTLLQTSQSYQVDKSCQTIDDQNSTALAVTLSVMSHNLDVIYGCPLSAAVTLAGHFWRYHLTRFEALCMELEHPNHMAQY